MRMKACTMGLASGLAALFLCTGCSQQELGGQGGVAEEQDVHAETGTDRLASATASAAAKPTVADRRARAAVEPQVLERVLAVNGKTRKLISERLAEVHDPAVQKRIENGDQYSKVSIKRSGHAERNAYEMARARAKGQHGAEVDR